MSDWGILDDSSVSVNGDVEYVGMATDDDVYPVRVPRRPVRRASQASIPTYNRPAPSPSHPMKPSSKDNLYHLPTTTGAEVAMNEEAVQNMRGGGVHDIGGRTARRVQPGMYVTYGPGRGPSGLLGVGMGGMGTDDDDDDENGGGFDFGGLIGGILGGGAALVTSITGGVATIREQRTSAELAAERIRLEDEAARESRAIAERENVREHQLRLADIRQQQEELAELQRTQAQLEQEQAQYNATSTLPTNGGGGGVSPVVWVLLAMVGIGGIGTVVWLLTRDKDEKK